MRPFSRRTLLFQIQSPSSSSSSSSSPQCLQISKFSASQNPQSHSNTVSPLRRHQFFEEESRNVRVSVWWDFENCGVPAGANVFQVTRNISAAVRANGIKGSIQITAFGDMVQLSRSNQEALLATGIGLTHIPRGGKNSADRSLFNDLMDWVSENPPPAHLFLISGDGDFAKILHRLRMSNYNVLLASTEASSFLSSASTITWNWQALVRGEDLAGRHFNPPPDGPYGSWYGHCKAPREDPPSATPGPQKKEPKAVGEVTRIPHNKHEVAGSNSHPQKKENESCQNSGLDSKTQPVQKTVLRQLNPGSLPRDATKDSDCDRSGGSVSGLDHENQNKTCREASGVHKSVANVVKRKRPLSTSEVRVEKASPEVQGLTKNGNEVLEVGVLRRISKWWLGGGSVSKE